MKRIFAMLLSVVLVFSLAFMTSCGDDGNDGADGSLERLVGKTPEELYDASVEALSMAGSYEVTTENDIIMDMSVSGQEVFVVMKQSATSKINGDDTYMKSTSTSEMITMGQITPLGDVAPMEVWYVDGICYSYMMGVKAKAAVDKEQFAQEYMGKDPKESTLLDLPESWFKDIKFDLADDGYVLNMVVSGEEYTQFIGNVYEELGYDLAIDGDVDYKIFFDKDGNLTKITADFNMIYNIQGTSGTAKCNSVSKVSMKDVTVEAPANADEFQEVELDLGN